MNCPPGTAGACGGTEQPGSRLGMLRSGAIGLYRALDSGDGSVTRYGIVPYSHTVNVARSLMNKDILTTQSYVDGQWVVDRCANQYSSSCVEVRSDTYPTTGWVNINGTWRYDRNRRFDHVGSKNVHISDSYWNNARGYQQGNVQGFRTSGMGCIEERPSVGTPANQFQVLRDVSRADIDTRAGNGGNQDRLQFGRYDPFVQRGHTQDGCPPEATRLQEYDSEGEFQGAIDDATAFATGGTYHDIGMLWGARFVSRTGFFAGNNFNQGDNVTEIDDIPVNTHIVFMTDGMLDTGPTLYSAYGVETYSRRLGNSGSQNERHIDRFAATCDAVRNMGVTVWVIAFDVPDEDDIEPCATTSEHFFVSDGTDLEQVFERIGQGIGNLRLTR
jgi:hypothetical protein